MSQQQSPSVLKAAGSGGEEPLLFTPLQIGNVHLRNRIVISPMCMYSAVEGHVNEWHLVHLGARAIGGAGVVMMEATGVERRGRISPGCPGLWSDEQIEPMRRVTAFVKAQGAVPAIQLAHSGRKGSTVPPWVHRNQALPPEEAWPTVAPSPIAYGGGNEQVPQEATLDDIKGFITSFSSAAKRAVKAGFEIIELHFAHGYLVQTFLSSLSNQRTDQYGGSFENRIRLALEIVKSVKEALPTGFPLFVRISADDNMPNGEGWNLSESIELAKRLKDAGVHLVDVSTGLNSWKAKTWFEKSSIDQVKMAATIQRESGIATGAVGGIVSAQYAEKVLRTKQATLIFIGRVSLEDPHWPIHAAFELNASTAYELPKQYVWSIGLPSWRANFLLNGNRDKLNGEA